MNATSYAKQLKQLLPPGLVWFLESTAKLTKTLLGISDELVRVDDRGADLQEEADPRTATETLDDWERLLGLPDEDITTIPATDAARRLAITQKYISLGGQTPAYYIGLAAACGYTVTITDPLAGDVLRSGFRSGDRCYGAGQAYTWLVTVTAPVGTALTHAELEAVIRRAAPAHTTVVFTYL